MIFVEVVVEDLLLRGSLGIRRWSLLPGSGKRNKGYLLSYRARLSLPCSPDEEVTPLNLVQGRRVLTSGDNSTLLQCIYFSLGVYG